MLGICIRVALDQLPLLSSLGYRELEGEDIAPAKNDGEAEPSAVDSPTLTNGLTETMGITEWNPSLYVVQRLDAK